MKDLFVITAYTPDDKRVQLLEKFVSSIDRDFFDVMISSHSHVPKHVVENVEYCIYERENLLIYDYDLKFHEVFGNEHFCVDSTENKEFNHFVAAIRLVNTGLSYAKTLGYEKAHVVEYDTLLKSNKEFYDNSRLLDEYSLVFYSRTYSPYIISFPMSFNLTKISDKWFRLNNEDFMNFLKESQFKTIEDYETRLVQDEKKIEKSETVFEENGVHINLYYSGENMSLLFVAHDCSDECFLFVSSYSADDLSVKINVKINDEDAMEMYANGNLWYLRSLREFSKVDNISILVNDTVKKFYDFKKISKIDYARKNFIHFNR